MSEIKSNHKIEDELSKAEQKIIDAATRGPWNAHGFISPEVSTPTDRYFKMCGCVDEDMSGGKADSLFIAYFNPEYERIRQAVCEAAEMWSREDEAENTARNEHALICAVSAWLSYRRQLYND
jgi:hypothetical protein